MSAYTFAGNSLRRHIFSKEDKMQFFPLILIGVVNNAETDILSTSPSSAYVLT